MEHQVRADRTGQANHPGVARSGQGRRAPTGGPRTDRRTSPACGRGFTRVGCTGAMPTQLRLVALAAVLSGLAAAGAVFAEDRWGVPLHAGPPRVD